MKILILTNKLPYPPRDGGSIATLNMMTGLHEAGNNITCLSLNTSKHNFPLERIPPNLSSTFRFFGVHCDTSIKPARMVFNLLFSKKPYIAERFNVRKYKEKLVELLKNESFDLVQLEGPYPGHFLDEIRKWSKAPVSLRAHNVEHLIWERKSIHEKSILKRWYLRNMATRLGKFEMQVANHSDYLIPISEQDEAYFRDKGYSKPMFTIPAGLSIEDYPQTPLPSDLTIFFIGALDWLPNQEGLTWFLDHVFEKLVTEMPQLRFHVAGRNAPDHFVKKLNHNNLVYHGEVDDAKKFMQSYGVMVVPLLTGSGIRIKILEAMALGRPVVTSSVGIEGIPAENNREVILADDPDMFKYQLVNMLSNPDEAGRMVSRARQLIQHNFDTFELSIRLKQVFQNAGMIILQVIFWVSLFLIIYSYLLFPIILHLLARNKKDDGKSSAPADLPFISVLIAAYNEEQVIGSKIVSILHSDYPSDRLEILVGSDASTDSTNEVLKRLQKENQSLRIFLFNERTGKPGVVNQLVEECTGEILVITDANVMLDSNALREMTKYFAKTGVGLVDSRMINTRLKKDGISHQEKFYISREVRIKHHESLIWGSMMGPFGGCYAVRKSLYKPVPANFLVDDFYINMAVLQQGYQCISNMEAKVYEDVSNNLQEEFRRKKRISAGNFQNLSAFGSLLISGKPGVSFCFFSHKVIRWFVPFLVMLTLGTSLALGIDMLIYRILALSQLFILVIPIIDHFLRKIKIHTIPLRFVSHFVLMNLALLAGFMRYLGGIKNNVWQPTRRNQD